jgi:acetyl esterase/lipase
MSSKRKSWLSLLLVSSLTFALTSPARAANPDDGYPQGVAAPGRTCPNSEVGFTAVSEITQKTLICTLINGEKKWWIQGEPLPAAPAATPTATSNATPSANNGDSSSNVPEIQYTPKYKLPAKSLAKMKVFENVIYSRNSPTHRLDIYMPKGVVKPPLIVWTHGGGFVFGDENFMKFDESAKLLEVFIKNGIAVASVNYRLAQEALFPAAGVDTKRAIRFLRANASKYGYDPKKFATG